eukprot:TRINITY_DN9268_c0_g1_i3.p1 TRINITY_DN9268_c0_g1~~TRINITY_DN9268_c0_g1_i3.p1  ORF type:complete len:202 (+),score=53.03 TRINITY_DN9268_c0_g1_i3:730-1335(+)
MKLESTTSHPSEKHGDARLYLHEQKSHETPSHLFTKRNVQLRSSKDASISQQKYNTPLPLEDAYTEEELQKIRSKERRIREQAKLQQEQLLELGEEEVQIFDTVIRAQLEEKLTELLSQKERKVAVCRTFQQDIRQKIEELELMLKEADWKMSEIENQYTDSADILVREYERALQSKKDRVSAILDRQLKELDEIAGRVSS